MNVTFPDKVWARLATIAELREMSIADLLVETAQAAVAEKPPARAPKHDEPPALPKFDPSDPVVVAKVRELYEANQSREEIAAAFRVAYEDVRTLCDRLGLAPRRYTQPKSVDEGRFLELYALNLSDVAIASRMDVSSASVGRMRRSLELPIIGRPGRPRKTSTNQETAA